VRIRVRLGAGLSRFAEAPLLSIDLADGAKFVAGRRLRQEANSKAIFGSGSSRRATPNAAWPKRLSNSSTPE
jgi:hypothetical protein